MTTVSSQYDPSISESVVDVHGYKMTTLEDIYNQTVRSHPVASFWLIVVLLVVVILLLWHVGAPAKKEGATFASGGAIARFEDQDDVRLDMGLARTADATQRQRLGSKESYIKGPKDKFVPGPEQKDTDGSIYVIDENGQKWYVVYNQAPGASAPTKSYLPYKPGAVQASQNAVLSMYGVDVSSCCPSGMTQQDCWDRLNPDNAWSWLVGVAQQGPEENYAVSRDGPLLQSMLGVKN